MADDNKPPADPGPPSETDAFVARVLGAQRANNTSNQAPPPQPAQPAQPTPQGKGKKKVLTNMKTSQQQQHPGDVIAASRTSRTNEGAGDGNDESNSWKTIPERRKKAAPLATSSQTVIPPVPLPLVPAMPKVEQREAPPVASPQPPIASLTDAQALQNGTNLSLEQLAEMNTRLEHRIAALPRPEFPRLSETLQDVQRSHTLDDIAAEVFGDQLASGTWDEAEGLLLSDAELMTLQPSATSLLDDHPRLFYDGNAERLPPKVRELIDGDEIKLECLPVSLAALIRTMTRSHELNHQNTAIFRQRVIEHIERNFAARLQELERHEAEAVQLKQLWRSQAIMMHTAVDKAFSLYDTGLGLIKQWLTNKNTEFNAKFQERMIRDLAGSALKEKLQQHETRRAPVIVMQKVQMILII